MSDRLGWVSYRILLTAMFLQEYPKGLILWKDHAHHDKLNESPFDPRRPLLK